MSQRQRRANRPSLRFTQHGIQNLILNLSLKNRTRVVLVKHFHPTVGRAAPLWVSWPGPARHGPRACGRHSAPQCVVYVQPPGTPRRVLQAHVSTPLAAMSSCPRRHGTQSGTQVPRQLARGARVGLQAACRPSIARTSPPRRAAAATGQVLPPPHRQDAFGQGRLQASVAFGLRVTRSLPGQRSP